MKRRLILMGSLVVVVALAAWMAFAYVQGAVPFAKTPKAQADLVLAAASQPGTCAHNCDPADCQKCPNMQGGKCVAAQGQTCKPGPACAPGACASSKDAKCAHAGNCICPKDAAGAVITAGACQGVSSSACPGMKAGGCASTAASGCQGAKSSGCGGAPTAGAAQTQAPAGCQAAKAAGMCGAKSTCGSTCPLTK